MDVATGELEREMPRTIDQVVKTAMLSVRHPESVRKAGQGTADVNRRFCERLAKRKKRASLEEARAMVRSFYEEYDRLIDSYLEGTIGRMGGTGQKSRVISALNCWRQSGTGGDSVREANNKKVKFKHDLTLCDGCQVIFSPLLYPLSYLGSQSEQTSARKRSSSLLR